MIRLAWSICVLLAVTTTLSAETNNMSSNQTDAIQQAAVVRNLSAMPLSFTQNNGQWPDSILYRANAGGATMWFTPNGAYYQFTRRVPGDNNPQQAVGHQDAVDEDGHRARYSVGRNPLPRRGRAQREVSTTVLPPSGAEGSKSGFDSSPVGRDLYGPDMASERIETMMIKASFVGCNPNPQLSGDNLLEYKCNYFLGNDQTKWRTDVPNYNSVTYKEVYPGIDLKYYGDGRRMEYDFIVPPGVDYSQIKIQYEGAKSLTVNTSGDLVIETAWGTVTEKAPVVYQFDGANRTAITGAYRVADSHSFGFSLGPEYNSSLSVVIDPVLVYSTYLGGNGGDGGYGIAVDGAGSAYVVGWAYSADFPTVTPFDGSISGGYDAFVTKLNPAGNALVYSTYLGGDSSEVGRSIAVDGAGSAYVTGVTSSADFPTATPFDGSFSGGSADAFVTKLNPAGNTLAYSTYLGGASGDGGYGIAVDGVGSAYVTGGTNSSNFPTATPFDGSFNGGTGDAFVTKLNPAGNTLAYSTYLGGNNYDYGNDIAVDGAGSAYLTGGTNSSNFPTVTPFDGSWNGDYDAFVTKLSPAGNTLAYSTYLGGASGDGGKGIAVDLAGSAYITGNTSSSDFPTANPFDGSLTGASDAFATKLSPAGNTLVYSTYLGGSSDGLGQGIAVDRTGSAYVTGVTLSSDFPTVDPFEGGFGGVSDAFVTKLSPAGNSLVYSSYLGGSGPDESCGIAVDGAGSAYVTGSTFSADFPTVNPFDGSYKGTTDAFVAKVSPSPPCCVGATGNVDCDPSDGVDISDLSALIDNLYVSFAPLCCPAEANADGQPGIDISDLSALIDYLYISFTPPAACQ
jgi:hypothetical protein